MAFNRSVLSRQISLVFIGATLVTTAHAADKELLDILLGNGAITKAQYDNLLAKEELKARDVEPVIIQLDKGGPRFTTADKQYSFRLGGRLHTDATMHSGDPVAGKEATDGTEIRRARLSVQGTLGNDFDYAAEADFADNQVQVKDFVLEYGGFDNLKLSVGHQKQPYSLGLEMSSNDMPFVERGIDESITTALTDRAIGARVDAVGDHWFMAAGLYGDSMAPNKTDDEGWGVAGRFIYSPIISDHQVLHLGVRGAYRAPSHDEDSIRFRDETTHMSNLAIVDTGTVAGVDGTTMFGGEVAYTYGPFTITGEYNNASVNRETGENLNFNTWNVQATWSLTGESRAAIYNLGSGEYKRLKAKQNFSLRNGGMGAWEVAARYAYVDFNDGVFTGGKEGALTAAINWYVNDNVRFMLDYTNILSTDGSNAVRLDGEGLDILQLRAQYTF
ncbi:MAG: porin [Gammaproteobacteria bacterium]|nr:porin [Gammaproteobacteria bacterium]